MNEPIQLSNLPKGKEAVIVDYLGSRGFAQKAIQMGLNRNEKLKVLDSFGGPVVIEIHGSKLALGRGVAMKILVRSL